MFETKTGPLWSVRSPQSPLCTGCAGKESKDAWKKKIHTGKNKDKTDKTQENECLDVATVERQDLTMAIHLTSSSWSLGCSCCSMAVMLPPRSHSVTFDARLLSTWIVLLHNEKFFFKDEIWRKCLFINLWGYLPKISLAIPDKNILVQVHSLLSPVATLCI